MCRFLTAQGSAPLASALFRVKSIVNALCQALSFVTCFEVLQDHFLWVSGQLSMAAASSLTPIFAGYVISLLLILPSSTLPGTRGQKLHLGNNLTNQLSGSPARTPTLELTQLLMLRLQPYGMSAKQQVPGSPGPHTVQLSPAKENQGEVFDTRPSSETVPPMPYLASWGLLSILLLPSAEPKNRALLKKEQQILSGTWIIGTDQDTPVSHRSELQQIYTKNTLRPTQVTTKYWYETNCGACPRCV